MFSCVPHCAAELIANRENVCVQASPLASSFSYPDAIYILDKLVPAFQRAAMKRINEKWL
jgi:hypothetical protein